MSKTGSKKQFHIVIGISGSVAAPKGIILARMLSKLAGVDVSIIASPSSKYFLEKHDWELVDSAVFDKECYSSVDKVKHVMIAQQTDLLVLYPATLNLLSACSTGAADTLPSLVFHAYDGPVMIQPAMNSKMYTSLAYRRNELWLSQDPRINILAPKTGRLACSDFGVGRAWEPEEMLAFIQKWMLTNSHNGPELN